LWKGGAGYTVWRGGPIMLGGVILLWFILTALSVAYVATDILSTPESPVLKWAFVLIAAYTGPFGAFLYVLGCREPLPGLHSRYVEARWRQVLGSTMHCVAGDGAGILAGAVIGSLLRVSPPTHVALEYVLGFGFGWTIFQALFMRDMAGGSFSRALQLTFVPEFLSMNALMAGMLPVMTVLMASLPGSEGPQSAAFWFVMSMALLAGAIIAYPINWWLVARHLKHGMMTVRRPETAGPIHSEAEHEKEQKTMAGGHAAKPSTAAIVKMAVLSMGIFGVGLMVSFIFRGSH
jgi:Domain of unknown function (DUF4396)